MKLDATDERSLRAAGIKDVDVAVVSIGENIESSLLVVTLVKELGIRNIVAKAVTPLHGRILEKLGVSRVVFPEREMAVRVAHSLVIPNVIDYIELSGDFSIVEVPAPAEFFGKTLRENRPAGPLRPDHHRHQAGQGRPGRGGHGLARARRRGPATATSWPCSAATSGSASSNRCSARQRRGIRRLAAYASPVRRFGGRKPSADVAGSDRANLRPKLRRRGLARILRARWFWPRTGPRPLPRPRRRVPCDQRPRA